MSILRRIRKAIRARQVELSDHALEEMDDDDLTLVDIRTVLSLENFAKGRKMIHEAIVMY